MKSERKRSGIVGLLGVAVVVVALSRLLRGQEAAPGTMLDSPLPTPPSQVTPTPSKTSSTEFVFGEPKVVFRSSSAINMIELLPDSDEILLTLRQSGIITETIITLNFISGEQRVFGQRLGDPAKPVWLNEHQLVAFTARTSLEELQHGLWINKAGESQAKQPAMLDIHPAILAYGDQVLVGAENVNQTRLVDRFGRAVDGNLLDLRALGFDLGDLHRTTSFIMEKAPSDARIALFDNQKFVIANLDSGETKEVNLGTKNTEFATGLRWAMLARWSPNGRYIAMITTISDDLPVHFTELAVWDSKTGDLHFIGPSPFLRPEQWNWELDFITDIAWAPDSYHLAVMKPVRRDEFGIRYDGIYMVRIDQDDLRSILERYEFGGKWGGILRWSSDGASVIAACPEMIGVEPFTFESQLCLISVQQISQEEVRL